MADGRIVVANGGIRTDPQHRSKLNLGSMRPNLSRLSPDGALLDEVEPPLPQNSIRHLALLPDGTVAFAMQREADPPEPLPQLGLWTPGTPPASARRPTTRLLSCKATPVRSRFRRRAT